MLTRLHAAQASSGGKAAAMGRLLRSGLPVPDGFVVTGDGIHAGGTDSLRTAIGRELARMGDPVVAVRSSAMNEDTAAASAAGQYESVIGVRGTARVCDAIVACRSSAHAPRVAHYWRSQLPGSAVTASPGMPVLVQRVVDADTSGVMFTPERAGSPTRIEASWGLGLTVVGGTVTPDSYEVRAGGSLSHTVGRKHVRIDLDGEGGGVAVHAVSAAQQGSRVLDDATVRALSDLGARIAEIQGGPQDVEWAVSDGVVWILQSRPITASLPLAGATASPLPARTMKGTPGSHGIAIGAARVVRGPSDFATVQSGEIVICPYTDPAWTPLFTIAAGVVTETGGALSHAAIVAREYGIPAVLGVPDALNSIQNGQRITLDGTAGTIAPA